ncbi:ParA family protein [Haliangium sp.]|uniref:ParA family protein n=1 Tax=Haliangium sp. TaxID=2663208 RepID=UPI003D112C90
MKIIAFFNNKGGVGKTSLVYHLAWTFSDLGYRVVATDLDPQANLSAMFLDEESLVEAFDATDTARTIYHAVEPLTGVSDISEVTLTEFGPRLSLLLGDIRLSVFEDSLSQSWTECLGRESRPFFVVTAFFRVLRSCAAEAEAEVVLVDVGPNLGAINRAALIAADHIVFPVGADLFSLYGLKNLGPSLHEWREEWRQRREYFAKKHLGQPLTLPAGTMKPTGYVTTQHSQYSGRASQAYKRWLDRIPEAYLRDVLRDRDSAIPAFDSDDNCLARIKHYRSLMPMAQEARKPIFHLTAADGAIGAHYYAAREGGEDFAALARELAVRCQLAPPDQG